MTAGKNRQYLLAKRPVGLPQRSDWNDVESAIPEPGAGEVLVKVLYLSIDPAMRGWMNKGRSYIAPLDLGDVMRAGGAGVVLKSNDPAFKPGDYVTGMTGVQAYAVKKASDLMIVDAKAMPLPVWLSVLGITGITAYFGLLEIGAPKAGDTVVVSGAAGGVGTVVGQLAKIHGCRAIGVAGGPEKCRALTEEFGFDAAIDYRHGVDEMRASLREHCPKGINVFFDNVGGDILQLALAQLAPRARVVLSGAISQYNNTEPPKGPANYMQLLVTRSRMEGFVVFDYEPRYGEARRALLQWLQQGRIRHREEIVEGLDHFPDALLKLFSGANTGKMILKVADE